MESQHEFVIPRNYSSITYPSIFVPNIKFNAHFSSRISLCNIRVYAEDKVHIKCCSSARLCIESRYHASSSGQLDSPPSYSLPCLPLLYLSIIFSSFMLSLFIFPRAFILFPSLLYMLPSLISCSLPFWPRAASSTGIFKIALL